MASSDNPESKGKSHQAGFSLPEERAIFVAEMIQDKLADYARYDINSAQSRALMLFVDLSQELEGRDIFYDVCLAIPQTLFGLESCLYVLEDEESFVLAGKTDGFTEKSPPMQGWSPELSVTTVKTENLFYVPVQCNPYNNNLLPFSPPGNVFGCFIFQIHGDIGTHDKVFLEKYVNRVGLQLQSRLLRDRNREHLAFIRNLVEDIGHNVIVPNIYFKLYFNQLRRSIDSLEGLAEKLHETESFSDDFSCASCAQQVREAHDAMREKFDEIYRHYVQTSLFLETLLRRRHFEEGRYVLEKRPCNLLSQIVEPQLKRYQPRLDERGILLDMAVGGAPPDQIIRMVVDVGLLSQVYANLFSNAVKYTREATLPDGRTGLFLSHGWRVLRDYFSSGVDGIRLHVLTTGRPLDLSNPLDVFQPGFRVLNELEERGTGHGLYFVRQVVELHRGEVGYVGHPYGSEFYFILPFELEGAPLPYFED